MRTFGDIPSRVDPLDGPSSRIAVLLPGRGYSPAAPLLFFATQVLVQHGWTVQQVWWDASECDDNPAPWVADQARAAIASEVDRADALVLVGKSLGTLASPIAAEIGIPAIWLTPLLHIDACAAGIRTGARAGHRQLLVGGTTDESWQPDTAAKLGASTCEIPDADHALCIAGDVVASAKAHVRVTQAMVAFVKALDVL